MARRPEHTAAGAAVKPELVFFTCAMSAAALSIGGLYYGCKASNEHSDAMFEAEKQKVRDRHTANRVAKTCLDAVWAVEEFGAPVSCDRPDQRAEIVPASAQPRLVCRCVRSNP